MCIAKRIVAYVLTFYLLQSGLNVYSNWLCWNYYLYRMIWSFFLPHFLSPFHSISIDKLMHMPNACDYRFLQVFPIESMAAYCIARTLKAYNHHHIWIYWFSNLGHQYNSEHIRSLMAHNGLVTPTFCFYQ